MSAPCCRPPSCDLECPCGIDDCFQIDPDDLPALVACGSNAAAHALIEAALGGVLRNHTGSESCGWWSKVCGDVGDGTINGYAMSLRRDATACAMALEVWQACDIPDIDDCCVGTRPPLSDSNVEWELVARYTFDPDQAGPFSCSQPNTFNLATQADGCATCADGGIDVDTWPSTINLNSTECDDSTQGGDECIDNCCGLSAHPAGLVVTFSSSCPELDGVTFTLSKTGPTHFYPAAAPDIPFPSNCNGHTNCTWSSFILFCLAQDLSQPCSAPGPCWTLQMGGGCQNNNCGMHATPETFEQPIAFSCDPLVIVFEKTITGEPGCTGCDGCLVTITVTD